MASMLLVLCDKRHTETMMQEFEDWNKKEQLGVNVVLYGTTLKAQEGFVLLELQKPLPEGVYANLVIDNDVDDYILYQSSTPTPA